MLNRMLFLIVTLFSLSVSAEEYTYIGGLDVVHVNAGYSDRDAYFTVGESVSENPAGCSNGVGNEAVFAVDADRSDVNQVISLLLFAYSTGKEVNIQVWNDSCSSGFRVIRRVQV
ncbi:hypothetical protein ACJJI5_09595 [Microbulbifer sp. EKSA008]|uniref:hypothetical protein n=1 Tax=unclassified Microbulbifer TaxID=2619833 RepID=UPI0040397CCE